MCQKGCTSDDMDTSELYSWVADAVLMLHVAVVIFIVGGMAAVVIKNLWLCKQPSQWINSLWFRLAHLSAVLFVVAEAWLQVACPLTTLEHWLREVPGLSVAGIEHPPAVGCIEQWMGKVLYFAAPWWVFALAYTFFGLLVIYTWLRFPPKHGR